MTPLQFETIHTPLWCELEASVALLAGGKKRRRAATTEAPLDAARFAAQYRQVCEHLALAEARAYPIYVTERLQTLVQSAHRLVYRERGNGKEQLARLLLVDFPQAVRAHHRYLAIATLLFVVPLLLAAILTWRDAGFILRVMDVSQVHQLGQMYGPSGNTLGRLRGADTDFMMFGHYIVNNIGIALRTFAGGLFGGVGSIVPLVYNGVIVGSVAGE